MSVGVGQSATLVEILGRSARVSLSATAIAVMIGVPAGTALALARFHGRRVVATFVHTGMALPTTVVGLVVALLLFRSGPLGSLNLIYTTEGMTLAQVVIATPLITGVTLAAIRALPPELPDQLRALGANRRQMVVRLWIEARVPLLAAVMVGFGHAISEVGAATMVGGNIHGQTQVLTTATVEDVSRGDFGPALGYGAVLLALAFVVNALLTSVQQRGSAWSQS
jgi:tungstate transport system permease protein